MGQAKRRREAGERMSFCRTCTACCTLPAIEALAKPAYRPCRHIAGGGCGIYGEPGRPGACAAYACAYLSARLSGGADRNRIPHPLDCGAYFHKDPVEPVIFAFIDPARPRLWTASALPALFHAFIADGLSLFITDRGRQMVIRDSFTLGQVVANDLVALADRDRRPLDVPSFRAS